MKFGRVVGMLVTSHSTPGMKGYPLLMVQLVDEHLTPHGEPVVAGDRIGVGVGEYVFMEEAREAGLGIEDPYVPFDLGIVGRADRWTVRGRNFKG